MEIEDIEKYKPVIEKLRNLSEVIELDSIPTKVLGISTSTYNALGRGGVLNLSSLLQNLNSIFEGDFKYMGPIKLQEVHDKLENWIDITFGYQPNQVMLHTSSITSETDPIELAARRRRKIDAGVISEDIGKNDSRWLQEHGIPRPGEENSKTDDQKKISKHVKVPLDQSMPLFLATLKPNHRKIIEDLFGFYTGQLLTLQAVSNLHGVTRERVRQVKTIVMNLYRNKGYAQPLTEFIEAQVRAHHGAISESHLCTKIEQETFNSELKARNIYAFYKDYLKGALPETVIYLENADTWSSVDYSTEFINRITETIPEIFADGNIPLQWNDLYIKLLSCEGMYTLDEGFALAVVKCLRENGKIEQLTNGRWALPGINLKLKDKIIIILKEIGYPVHFKEITKIYNQQFPENQCRPNVIMNILQGKNGFVRVGRGLYGLPEWGLHDDGSLANAVRRILAASGKPMSLDEICAEVLKTWQVSEISILVAIQTDTRFEKTDEKTYQLTSTGMKVKKIKKRSDTSRRERVAETMRIMAAPARYDEITEKHNEIYPNTPLTSEAVRSILTTVKEQFHLIERSTYALVEWQIDPGRYIADKMYMRLLTTGDPFYLDEPDRGFRNRNGVSRDEIIAAIMNDPRLMIEDGFIILKQWDTEFAAQKIKRAKQLMDDARRASKRSISIGEWSS